MIYMRCKCGKSECWTSMGTQPCKGCDECHTQYATHPTDHLPLEPHDWETKYNENTGKPYLRCRRCYHTDPESFKASRVRD